MPEQPFDEFSYMQDLISQGASYDEASKMAREYKKYLGSNTEKTSPTNVREQAFQKTFQQVPSKDPDTPFKLMVQNLSEQTGFPARTPGGEVPSFQSPGQMTKSDFAKILAGLGVAGITAGTGGAATPIISALGAIPAGFMAANATENMSDVPGKLAGAFAAGQIGNLLPGAGNSFKYLKDANVGSFRSVLQDLVGMGKASLRGAAEGIGATGAQDAVDEVSHRVTGDPRSLADQGASGLAGHYGEAGAIGALLGNAGWSMDRIKQFKQNQRGMQQLEALLGPQKAQEFMDNMEARSIPEGPVLGKQATDYRMAIKPPGVAAQEANIGKQQGMLALQAADDKVEMARKALENAKGQAGYDKAFQQYTIAKAQQDALTQGFDRKIIDARRDAQAARLGQAQELQQESGIRKDPYYELKTAEQEALLKAADAQVGKSRVNDPKKPVPYGPENSELEKYNLAQINKQQLALKQKLEQVNRDNTISFKSGVTTDQEKAANDFHAQILDRINKEPNRLSSDVLGDALYEATPQQLAGFLGKFKDSKDEFRNYLTAAVLRKGLNFDKDVADFSGLPKALNESGLRDEAKRKILFNSTEEEKKYWKNMAALDKMASEQKNGGTAGKIISGLPSAAGIYWITRRHVGDEGAVPVTAAYLGARLVPYTKLAQMMSDSSIIQDMEKLNNMGKAATPAAVAALDKKLSQYSVTSFARPEDDKKALLQGFVWDDKAHKYIDKRSEIKKALDSIKNGVYSAIDY